MNLIQHIRSWFSEHKFNLLEVLVTTLIFMGGAFYNEFPLLSGDSAIYISSGFDGVVPSERPIFYGWFVRLFSFDTSLWGPIGVQNLVLAVLLIKLTKHLLPNLALNKRIAVYLFMVVFTQLTWETNKIMADIFIVYLTLSVYVWLFIPLTKPWKYFILLLVFYSASTHNSHVVIGLLACFVMLLVFIIKKQKQLAKKVSYLLIPLILAPVSIGFTNMHFGNGFTLGKATSVFLVGKMCENGMLKTYLDEHCQQKDLKLCAYKDSLPHVAWQFVWHPESPVMKTGGWAANDAEYKRIVHETFTTPKYLWMHLYKGITATLVQLTQISAGDALFRYEEYDNTMLAIRKYYPHETNPALWTRQRILELDFNWYARIYGFFFLISTIAVLWFLKDHALSSEMLWLLLLLVVFVVINAGVTANVANISSRLQARIFWLLPVWHIIALLQLLPLTSVFKKLRN